MIDDEKNSLLKQKVVERSNDSNFVHHQWFVKYHLGIVEQIAHELCELYPDADRLFVDTLVWLHDYEKIVDFDKQYNTELLATRSIMKDVGYSTDSIEEIAQSINQYNAKENLASARIEIQIVSSSDAASHLVGPFITLYWYENPSNSIAQIQTENARKLSVDWEKKVTLPEVKKAFDKRHQYWLEIAGILPSSFLD
jgi:hypothetical protein